MDKKSFNNKHLAGFSVARLYRRRDVISQTVRYTLRYMAHMGRTILFLAASLALNAYAQSPTTIPYESPRAAYVALSKDPGAKLKSNAQGWEIVHVSEGANEGIWTFAPNSHPSFPSVVRRQILEQDGQLFVGMRILCGGAKAACDQYVAEFKELNEQMAKELNQRRAEGKSTR